jgi:phosphatidylglycerophosphatase C
MAAGVAIFDFDRTLIRQGSMALFLEACVGKGNFLAAAGMAVAGAAWAGNQRRREIFRAGLLRRTLAGATATTVRTAAQKIHQRIEWKEEILSAVERHRAAGHLILIATGGLECYMRILLDLKPLAVDGLLASEMSMDANGRLTGEMAGPSCTWEEKARRVAGWLHGRDVEIWAYGNLPNDTAMLALAHHRVVVPR